MLTRKRKAPSKGTDDDNLMWKAYTPITIVNSENTEAVLEWLKDRSTLHTWITSIITGSFFLITIFGKKPNFHTTIGVTLAIAILIMVLAIICNIMCVWQIPKWKYAVKTGIVKHGNRMVFDLELQAWFGFILYLLGVVLAAVGNIYL